MNTLKLENINKQAPYKVALETSGVYYFYTDFGVGYEIVIKPNISRLDNPNLQRAIQEFDDTISFLFD